MTKKVKRKSKNKSQTTVRTNSSLRKPATAAEPPPETRSDPYPDSEDKSGVQNYDENVKTLLDPWKALASESQKAGLKSLMELLRDTKDEATRIALKAIKTTAIRLGIRLSKFIAEYLLVYWRHDTKEIALKSRVLANTIRLESLGDDSSGIADKFVAAIELVDGEIGFPIHYNDRKFFDDDPDEVEDHSVWVNKRENRILGLIFFRVLFLEIVFCFPGFGEGDENERFERIAEFVARRESGFEDGMRSLRSEIDALKKEENQSGDECPENIEGLCSNGFDDVEDLKELRVKNSIAFKIEEMWNQTEVVPNGVH